MKDYDNAKYVLELADQMNELFLKIHNTKADFSTSRNDMDWAMIEMEGNIDTVRAACREFIEGVDDQGGPAMTQYNMERENERKLD